MKKRIFLLVVLFIPALGYGDSDATNYYMKPSGSDALSGLSTSLAWATLAHAKDVLVAGDTLFVMGGTYSNVQHWQSGRSGTKLRPIVIKAYGDAVAIFTNAGIGDYGIFFQNYATVENHFVIDGESHLKHAPYPTTTRFLVFQGNLGAGWQGLIQWMTFSSSDKSYGLVVRNCEIDGRLTTNTSALYMVCCDSFLVENNYFHHTGLAASGDAQGSPDLMWLMSCSYGIVRNNTFEYGNHALIDMSGPYGVCKYVTFSGNVFNNRWGGGLYLMSSRYCLVDQNQFLHSGESTTYTKPAIQMNSCYNTIRRNVFYNPGNAGLFLAGSFMTGGAGGSWVQHNYIYNNTFFNNEGYPNICMLIYDLTDQPDNSVENNFFYNNIIYKSLGIWDLGPGYQYKSEIGVDAINSNATHDWTTPAWGGNKFFNNLIRHDARGIAKDSMVAFAPRGGYVNAYTIPYLQTNWDTLWGDNIGGDPKLASESPDTYGTGWWYLQAGSAAIDSGMAVVDSNGIKVEAVAPGYGWGNLTYYGPAPDIGAYEVSTSLITSGTVSPTSMSFGTYVIGDTTAVDSFKIKNTGTDWLRGMVYGGSVDFSIITYENVMYSIAPNDSIWVRVRFTPTAGGLLSSHIHTGNPVLSTVTLTGGAVLMTPASIAFDDVKVGECDTSYIYLKNTGTGTVTGTVGGDSPDYDIFDGDGAFSLADGEIDTISVEFCPLTSGLKTFVVHLGSYFGIKDVSFIVNKSAIQVLFTTTEAAGCQIWGGTYDADDPEGVTFTPWYYNTTVHGVTHQHLISGLAASTMYAISIRANTAGGESAWAPGTSTNHYYIVQTAASDNTGGGLIGTEW